MVFFVDGAKVLLIDVGINLGGRDIGMADKNDGKKCRFSKKMLREGELSV